MSPSQRRGKKLISEGDLNVVVVIILSSFFIIFLNSSEIIPKTWSRTRAVNAATTWKWYDDEVSLSGSVTVMFHVIKKNHYLINFKLIILSKKLKRATVIQQFKAQPLYGGLKSNRYTAVSRQAKPAFLRHCRPARGPPPVRGVPSPGEARFVWREDPLPLRIRNGGGCPRQGIFKSVKF